MELLYILIGGLMALLVLKKGAPSSSEAENQKTKEKLQEIEKETAKAEAAIEAEETARESIKKEMTEKANEVLSPKDVVDFFNNRKS